MVKHGVCFRKKFAKLKNYQFLADLKRFVEKLKDGSKTKRKAIREKIL